MSVGVDPGLVPATAGPSWGEAYMLVCDVQRELGLAGRCALGEVEEVAAKAAVLEAAAHISPRAQEQALDDWMFAAVEHLHWHAQWAARLDQP